MDKGQWTTDEARPGSLRVLTGQLADDLGWLEQHARGRRDGEASAERDRAAARLRLAAALVRNCIGPRLDDQPPIPLHVVVVGGAGAGKSTVANLLSGGTGAEANPQAGFTRHPIAYVGDNGSPQWTGHLGFLGPLRRLTLPSPSSLDEDVYQIRRVPADPSSYNLLKDFVVWDCPDMTTWAAEGYVPRLLEVAALADVLVYVASDERYNDEVPTQFLRLLLQTGKPVVVCLMKMREADVPVLLAHFQQEVLPRLPSGVVGCLAIPHLTPAQLADPVHEAARYRIPLLNQVAVLGNVARAARQRSVQGAVRYLVAHQDSLLSVARDDLQALQSWRDVVARGQHEFEDRYYREYLTSEKFRGFDEALVRLLQLLELPGVGKVVSGILQVLRTPYQLLRGLIGKAVSRPDAVSRSELPILEEALAGWIDLLRKEAAQHANEHSLWEHVAAGFQSGSLAEQAQERFQQSYRSFQAGLNQEVDRTARAIYEELEKRPAVLNSLRGGKFALDVGAIAGTLVAGIGHSVVQDIILVPLAAAMTHQLVELLGRQVVDAQREQTRERQLELMKQNVARPLAEWLTQWPATGGSQFERLQTALRRIPVAIRQLALVRES